MQPPPLCRILDGPLHPPLNLAEFSAPDADDTTIYFNLEDFPALYREQEINKELEKLNIWFKLNKWTLNVDKTKCMFFFTKIELFLLLIYQ